ncbi:MAG: Rieske 2Fe-2S domain-containing protein [Chloroflexi bacterium]|nr:Rieske 2Fe-2S domain-containing protein [Chloroflexota bacterium]
MLTHEENELLTRVGPGTEMNELFRRFWLPALLAEEMPAPDSPPVRVTLLGEDLVAFKDTAGRIGFLDKRCPHRLANLFWGRNEEGGLRCIYHGWKYDASGRVVDTPAEPAGSSFKDRLRHPAYPTHEAGGIVFAYLGPPEIEPLFPNFEWTAVPAERTYVTKSLLECNWLQGLEGECDNSHLDYLHRSAAEGVSVLEVPTIAVTWEFEPTDFGLRYVATRQRQDGKGLVEVKSFVVPNACYLGVGLSARGEGYEVHYYVPATDTTSWRYDFGFLHTRPVEPRDVHRRLQIGPDYRRFRNMANQYLQDRALQKSQDYTGIEDFLNEDACATETAGEVADRTAEHLGASDRAVIEIRRCLLDAVHTLQEGGELTHLVRDARMNNMRHVDAIDRLIDGSDWRSAFPHLTREAQLVPAGRGPA